MLILTVFIAALSFTSTTQASDWFGGGNNGEWKQGPYGMYWDDSGWPEWTPMYWMEEFMDEFDNNSWGGNNWGGNNWGSNNFGGYGMPNGGYNINPYQYNMPNGNYMYPQMIPQLPTIPVQ